MLTEPHIDVDGVRNFRRVVVPSTPHGPLRAGRWFRSGALNGVSDSGRTTIAELGITDVVDLRSDVDPSGNAPPDLGPAIRVHSLPVSTDPAGTHPIMVALRSGDPALLQEVLADRDAVIEWMQLGYVRLALEETASFSRALRITAESEGAVVVNCAGGKDRTGWAVVTALLALGADLDAVTDEYLLSNVAASTGLDTETAARWEPLIGVRAEYLQAGLDAVATRWSSIDHYLEDGLGVDDELRDRLVRVLVEPQAG